MSFIQAIKSGFLRYFDFKGRSRRSEFWYWMLFLFLVDIISNLFVLSSISWGFLLGFLPFYSYLFYVIYIPIVFLVLIILYLVGFSSVTLGVVSMVTNFYWYFVNEIDIRDFVLFFIQMVLFIPSVALLVRRLHDITRSGWWIVLWFLIVGPGIFFLTLFVLRLILSGDEVGQLPLLVWFITLQVLGLAALPFLCLKGREAWNRFGTNPRAQDE